MTTAEFMQGAFTGVLDLAREEIRRDPGTEMREVLRARMKADPVGVDALVAGGVADKAGSARLPGRSG